MLDTFADIHREAMPISLRVSGWSGIRHAATERYMRASCAVRGCNLRSEDSYQRHDAALTSSTPEAASNQSAELVEGRADDINVR